MPLKERVAIVTGGAGVNGLGFATARMLAAQGRASSSSTWRRAIRALPQPNSGRASDIAGAVVFLASDLSAYRTGARPTGESP